MRKIATIVIFLIIYGTNVNSQELIDIKDNTTCEKARLISTMRKFGPTTAPVSSSTSSNDPFQRKNNYVWYKFTIKKSGKLLFDIIPINPTDNYDFILYKESGDNICQSIKDKSIKPVKYNIFKTDANNNGYTGLSINGDKKTYEEGVDVKKGENYYLLLNNVYEKGKGHSIVFKYYETYFIKGVVKNKKNDQPLKATVAWTNIRTGQRTSETKTDKKGNFNLKISVSTEAHKFPKYNLAIFSDKFFIADTVIVSKKVVNIEKTNFEFKLNKLKKGVNAFIPHVYFEANSSAMTPASLKACDKLYRLLNENRKIEIVLEGHSNGFYPSTEVDQKLSESRANTVRNYLLGKGVDSKRLSIKGFGSTKLLYPKAQNETEEGFNRRVEIFIKKY